MSRWKLFWLLLPTLVLPQQKLADAPPQPTQEVQKILNEGSAAEKKYDWAAAVKIYEQGLQTAKNAKDEEGEARILNSLGVIYSSTGQPQKAVEFYQQALPLYERTGNKDRKANVFLSLGIVYSDTGQPQKAVEYYQQALPLYRQIGNKTGEARILGSLGIVYSNTGQFQKAEQYLLQALPIFLQTGRKQKRGSKCLAQSRRCLLCHRTTPKSHRLLSTGIAALSSDRRPEWRSQHVERSWFGIFQCRTTSNSHRLLSEGIFLVQNDWR